MLRASDSSPVPALQVLAQNNVALGNEISLLIAHAESLCAKGLPNRCRRLSDQAGRLLKISAQNTAAILHLAEHELQRCAEANATPDTPES